MKIIDKDELKSKMNVVWDDPYHADELLFKAIDYNCGEEVATNFMYLTALRAMTYDKSEFVDIDVDFNKLLPKFWDNFDKSYEYKVKFMQSDKTIDNIMDNIVLLQTNFSEKYFKQLANQYGYDVVNKLLKISDNAQQELNKHAKSTSDIIAMALKEEKIPFNFEVRTTQVAFKKLSKDTQEQYTKLKNKAKLVQYTEQLLNFN